MAIALVQQGNGHQGYGPTLSISLPGPTTIGNTIIYQNIGGPSTTITGISGGGVTTWTQQVIKSLSAFKVDQWSGVVTSSSSAPVVATASFNVSWNANAQEYSGILTSGTVTDGVNSASGINGTALNSGSVTPTAGTSVLILAAGSFQAGASPSEPNVPPYTAVTASFNQQPTVYQIVSSASGSYSVSYQIAYNSYVICIVAYKGAGGAPPAINSNFLMFMK